VKKSYTQGFTLIEVLLVIAILAILAAVVIVAINPGKQFSEAQDTQRRSDVRAILDGIHQYSIDNAGVYPEGIPVGDTCVSEGYDICQLEISCDGVSIDEVIVGGKYLVDLPNDPTSATADITGYKISANTNGRISVCAPYTEGDDEISVTR